MATVRSRQLKKEGSPPHRSIGKSLILTILTLLVLVVMFISGQLVRREYSFHPISGTSMSPTLTEKDMVLVKKRKPIQRYSVIAFSVKGEEGKFVKRVIGMPGDTMFIRNDRMVLNIGEHGDFETTYTFQLSPAVAEEFQDLTKIPKGMYFTTGDHIDVSKDSRTFGFVYKKEIEGTVQFHLPSLIKKQAESQ
ncbi:signal peptidase I [Enterococcus hulanensis]|uniref:Signal peptidase I n=1 Tax=Enterococcus hulanensis TaxID=2559929 RepID=A0ABU3F0E5_9ENTE|nr:signal peptidase I [Enterococcus hulanensis]MDT2600610.1 signal peptidase I [Enterococcus hulanensis]MDT2609652.1 signal peptidase I [Enterococcus hulanensis]MDT2617720.1 signal peptidase I [Enterococcus hulanensis]MDT2628945.1 signal peptidase I [Enterococcus hulanensis]MDT2656285.1 signal peptidase I [Enterococcus hulanensis]